MTTTANEAVGWIGLGDQGAPMARAIADSGYTLHVRARRPQSIEVLEGTPTSPTSRWPNSPLRATSSDRPQ